MRSVSWGSELPPPHLGPSTRQRGDRRPQRRIGCQHAVSAVAMPAWRWNQGRQTLDQFERGEHQADATARAWLDAFIDQVLGIDFTQSLQRKGRPGAIPQQAFQALPVRRLDAHAGIEREAPAVIPGAHGLRVFPLEQTAPGQRAQKAETDLGLYSG